MAEAIEISVQNVEEVKKIIDKFAKSIETNINLNTDLSKKLASKASAMAPRLTGALASSVDANPSEQKAQIVAGNASVPYAGVQEYGWPERNIQAQPYLRPAVFNNTGLIIETYNKHIEDEIKKYNLD
jgi:phage gpG-like protein